MAKLSVKLADRPEEIEQALRLRYQVFAEEGRCAHMRNAEGIERDEFDALCDHLIVRDEEKQLVVGVYRLLPGARVRDGRIYTATEFDLGGFAQEVPHALEIGRSCVHPDYRDKWTMLLLWNCMLGYFCAGNYRWLLGCASVRTGDRDALDTLYSHFRDRACTLERFRIRPLPRLRVPDLRYVGPVDETNALALLPPLFRAYLRLGGEVLHEPIYDPLFETYDFCMILPKHRMAQRYRRHLSLSTLSPEPARCIGGSAA